jgi:hypothetical protein
VSRTVLHQACRRAGAATVLVGFHVLGSCSHNGLYAVYKPPVSTFHRNALSPSSEWQSVSGGEKQLREGNMSVL